MDLFQQNLALLRKKDPQLSEAVARQGISGRFQAVMTPSGLPTLQVDEGGMGFLHSPVNPAGEAAHLAETCRLGRNDGTILYGLGLGYLAREIVRRMDPGHVLYVAEPFLEILKLAITHLDLSEMLADDRVLLFAGDDIDRIPDRFSPIQRKILTGRIHKLFLPPLKALCPSRYDEVDARVSEHVRSVQVSFSSFTRLKGIFLSNLFRNLPAFLHSSPVHRLAGALKKRPALVVSAGPSLDETTAAIRDCGPGFAVLSVDAAVKPLVRGGITPHVVVNCDPHQVNRNKVSGLPDELFGAAALVFQADGSPEVITPFRGPRFFTEPPNSLGHWLANAGRPVPQFPAFQGASQLAFLLAARMEADPIILVGLDLSFPGDRHHAEGCGYTWGVECSKGGFPRVPSNDGGMVKTAPILQIMLHQIERDIRATPSRCVNVSGKGARIQGAECMTIEEALKAARSDMTRGVPFPEILEEAWRADPAPPTAEVAEALKWMVSEAESTRALAEKAVQGIGIRREERERLYLEASRHTDFLKAVSDFLPRTMIAGTRNARSATGPGEGFPFRNPDEETLTLFFEEMNELLPELLRHSREALNTLQGETGPLGSEKT